MKYLKLLLIFFLISLLNSCGYKKLNSEKLESFKIDRLEVNGDKKLGLKLKNNIEIYSFQNSTYWMGPEVIISTAEQGRVRAFGRVWDFEGRSAELYKIKWGTH